MKWIKALWFATSYCAMAFAAEVHAGPLEQPANTWVKRSPLADTPISPRLGMRERSFGITSTA
jgi:hypothetical protein